MQRQIHRAQARPSAKRRVRRLSTAFEGRQDEESRRGQRSGPNRLRGVKPRASIPPRERFTLSFRRPVLRTGRFLFARFIRIYPESIFIFPQSNIFLRAAFRGSMADADRYLFAASHHFSFLDSCSLRCCTKSRELI
jgi:hypothetical protein